MEQEGEHRYDHDAPAEAGERAKEAGAERAERDEQGHDGERHGDPARTMCGCDMCCMVASVRQGRNCMASTMRRADTALFHCADEPDSFANPTSGPSYRC